MTAQVELFDDLDAVARDANGALGRATVPFLFDRLDWYRLTVACCPLTGRPLVVRAAEGDARAWLFLMRERRTARALASWYTLDYGPVLGDKHAAALLPAIAATLRRRRLSRLELAPMSAPMPLAAALRGAGWIVRVAPATTNWRVRITGQDFATYWQRRPSRLREIVRRKSRAGPDIRIYNAFDEEAWKAYEQVYARSWKPAEGAPAFLRALAEAGGATGAFRLGIASIGGHPAAAQLWLVENGVATIHKLAHDEAYRDSSPGTLLSAAMFRHVIEEDRPDLIDFGTGDDPYKADWMDERRILYRIEAWNPGTAAGLVGAAGATARSLVRHWRKG